MTPFQATRFVIAVTAAGLLVAGVARAQTATPGAATPATPPAVTAPAPGAGPGTMGPGMMTPGAHRDRMHGHHMDTDGDGALSRAELLEHQKRALERFDQADVNKDGKLTRDERRAFKMAHAGEMGGRHRHHGDPSVPAGAASAAPNAPTAPAPAR